MGIKLSIKLGDTLAESKVVATGYEVYPLDDQMAREFGIPRTIVGKGSDDRIWSFMARSTGRVPNEFYLSDPVNGSDWVTRTDWTPFKDQSLVGVRIEKRPKTATLVSATGKPKQLATDIVRNPPEARTNQTGSVTLSESVTEESSHTREKNWNIGIDQTIGIEVEGGIPGLGQATVSRSMTLRFDAGGSDSKTQTHSKSLEQSRSANYDVPPGRVHEYSLSVGSGRIEIDVEYEYCLVGKGLAMYKKELSSGHWHTFNITGLMDYLGLPDRLISTDRESIGLVSEATLDRFVRDFDESKDR